MKVNVCPETRAERPLAAGFRAMMRARPTCRNTPAPGRTSFRPATPTVEESRMQKEDNPGGGDGVEVCLDEEVPPPPSGGGRGEPRGAADRCGVEP